MALLPCPSMARSAAASGSPLAPTAAPMLSGRSPAFLDQRAPGPRRVRPAPSMRPGPRIATSSRPMPQIRLFCQWLWPKSW